MTWWDEHGYPEYPATGQQTIARGEPDPTGGSQPSPNGPLTPTGPLQPSGGDATDFGDISDTATWQAIIHDDARFRAWLKQTLTQANGTPPDDGLISYYMGKIRETTDANGNGSYWLDKIKGDARGGSGAGGGVTPGPGYLAQIYGGQFGAPSLDEARNSPGYQFALQEGLKGVTQGAAARGTLNTGRTLKDLAAYGTGLADQTYGNLFNRNLSTFQTNYGVFRNNQNDLFNRYYSVANLGAPRS